MIIIVEGPDNSGKSTLAKELSELLGYTVSHPGGSPKTIDAATACCADQQSRLEHAESLKLIMDRVTCISDLAYQDRNHDLYNLYQRQMIASNGVVLVYCRPPKRVIRSFKGTGIKPHKSAEEVKFARSNIKRIIDSYDSIMQHLPHFVYDHTQDTAVKLAAKIVGGV